MIRLTIKQIEALIAYFQDAGEYLDATDTREDVENLLNKEETGD